MIREQEITLHYCSAA